MHQRVANLPARNRDERGYALVELMVVVLILAVLIGIAVPTFLGAKTRAQAKVPQASLKYALTDAKAIYNDTGSYLNVTVGALTTAEASVSFVATGTASTTPKKVSVNMATPAAGGTVIIMTARSQSNVCYVVGSWSLGGTYFAKLASGATCSATQATTTLTTVRPTPTTTSNSTSTIGKWVAAW
jgi:prepilin-type N-terminal cleavage/methylation domain